MSGAEEGTAATAGSAIDLSPFLAGVGASFILKLTTSVDDLFWFSPFLAMSKSTAGKTKSCVVYLSVCLLVSVAAIGIAEAAEVGFEAAISALGGGGDDNDGEGGEGGSDPFWDASRILSFVASAIIGAYAFAEYRSWLREKGLSMCSACIFFHRAACRIFGRVIHRDRVVDSEKGDVNVEQSNDIEESLVSDCKNDKSLPSHPLDSSTATSREDENYNPCDVTEEEEEEEEEEIRENVRDASRSTCGLFVVAASGTIDDLVAFAAAIAGRGGIPWTSVVPGTMLAACVILALSWQISLCAPFANFVRRIPPWTLLAVISIYLLIGSFV